MSFFKKGSLDYLINLLKLSGINLINIKFIENIIKKFDSLVVEFEKLL